MEQYLTFNELKGVLKKSKSTVYEMIRHNGLEPTMYIGMSPRWAESSVACWLSRQPKTYAEAQTLVEKISAAKNAVDNWQ